MNSPLHTAGILQTRAYRILQSRVNDCLLQHGLNHGQWVMLGVVSDEVSGVRLNRTAEILGVKAPLVTAMANDLIALGYIERQSHQYDRRAKLLTISEKGKLLLVEVQGCMNSTLSPLLEGLTRHDLDTYLKVLETIIANNEYSSRS
jgi:MarR family transcriptional regulator for hemolysin